MRALIEKLTGGRLVGQRLAVGLAPGELHLALATRNGALRLEQAADVEVRGTALRPGLRSPNVLEPDALGDALGSALEALRRRGPSIGRQRLVSLVVPDAAVRMTTVPLEGGAPGSAEGRAMAAWALRDLLPFPVAEARVDWEAFGPGLEANGDNGGVVGGRGGTDESSDARRASEAAPERAGLDELPAERGWLLAIGADPAVVREYEAVPQGAVAGAVGRVVPWTLAAAAGADLHGAEESAASDEGAATGSTRTPTPGPRLVLCGVGGLMACLVEEDGVPRFHRAWRGRLGAAEVSREIDALAAYVRDKLGLRGGAGGSVRSGESAGTGDSGETGGSGASGGAGGIAEAVVCGPDDWVEVARGACAAHGWAVRRLPVGQALLGSLKR